MLTELRSGREWLLVEKDLQFVATFFSICRKHGSRAIWLSDVGLLLTHDPDEVAKNFPYEDWLEVARCLKNSNGNI